MIRIALFTNSIFINMITFYRTTCSLLFQSMEPHNCERKLFVVIQKSEECTTRKVVEWMKAKAKKDKKKPLLIPLRNKYARTVWEKNTDKLLLFPHNLISRAQSCLL